MAGVFRAALAGFLAFSAAACGAKAISVGSVPFPAETPVFVDSAGNAAASLPDSPEPLRLILLDFTWCPPCADAWNAIRQASREIPPGSVRVYRILFDRERLIRGDRTEEVEPHRATAAPDAGSLPVTSVLALQGPFRKMYEVEQAPLLLLTDRGGKVLGRWTGSFSSLPGAVISEVKRLSSAPPLPET